MLRRVEARREQRTTRQKTQNIPCSFPCVIGVGPKQVARRASPSSSKWSEALYTSRAFCSPPPANRPHIQRHTRHRIQLHLPIQPLLTTRIHPPHIQQRRRRRRQLRINRRPPITPPHNTTPTPSRHLPSATSRRHHRHIRASTSRSSSTSAATPTTSSTATFPTRPPPHERRRHRRNARSRARRRRILRCSVVRARARRILIPTKPSTPSSPT